MILVDPINDHLKIQYSTDFAMLYCAVCVCLGAWNDQAA